MSTIVLALNPSKLENPDLDLRYMLPDMLAKRSGGAIKDDGYDYASDGKTLLLFLQSDSVDLAMSFIVDFIENEVVLGNRLAGGTTILVKGPNGDEIVYPKAAQRPF